jgi:hypothetical protein
MDVLNNLPKAPLDKIDSLNALFATLQDKVNLVCPLAAVDTILPMHQVSLRAVYINPEVNAKGVGPECYQGKPWCEDDEVALGKVALDKIEGAAGVRRVGGGRTDDRSEPFYCEFNVTLEITDFDGTTRTASNTKAVDLRDGAPETLKAEYVSNRKTGRMVPMDPSALNAKRQHMLALCETKARLRSLRELLALQQKYTLEDMAKPFVIPKLVPHLDPNDPETKTALINHALGGTRELYGKPAAVLGAAQLPPEQMPPIKTVDGERVDETAERVDETHQETAVEPSDDLEGFAPPKAVAHFECGCPCAHLQEITEERANASIKHVGSARCPKCFPGKLFDFEMHKDVRTLELKSFPNLTPAEAQKMALKARAADTKK